MHESDVLKLYIDLFSNALSTPAGLAALFAVLAMFVISATVQSARWWFLLGLIYCATLPLINSESGYSTLVPPLQQLRQYARPLTYLFAFLLLLPLIMSPRGWRHRLLTLPLILFFVFELSICFRLVALGNQFRGARSLTSYFLLMLTLGIALSRWLQSTDDVYRTLWAISNAGGLVALSTCWQLILNRSSIIAGNRLTGITGNPQYLGLVIAFTLPTTCYLLSRRSGRKWIRPILIAQISFTIVMLMWTGSRTGALSTLTGLIVLFHRQVGRLLVAAAFILVTVLLLLPYFEGSAETASRLLSTQNTREGTWAVMLSDISDAPWFGVSRDLIEIRESSYLAMLSQFGIIGSIPCVLAIVAMGWQCARLQILRSKFQDESRLVDVVTAFWATLAVGAAFEGILMGVFTVTVILIYVFASLTSFLFDCVQAEAVQSAADYQGTEWPAL